MQKYNLVAELDPHNAGVLVVHLNGSQPSRGGNRGLDPNEITNRLDNENCVVM